MPSLLLIAPAFAPSRLIGARRADRLAGALTRLGWQVTVLTLRPRYMEPNDPGLLRPDGVEVLETEAFIPRMWLRPVWRRLRPVATGQAPAATSTPSANPGRRSALADLTKWLEFPDACIGWLPFALAAVRGRRFDVVMGTMPWFSVAVVAGQVARECKARLVLDYRDPWSEIVTASSAPTRSEAAWRAAHRALEDRLLHQADLVVAVTPTLRRWLQARTPVPVELVTNGMPTPAFPAFSPPTVPPRLVYAGSLAYGRDLRPLLQAMALLRRDANPVPLQLIYAGRDGAGLVQQARDLGVADAVTDVGEQTSAQALALLDGALAGVVVVSPDFQYAYPGKIFEILGRARPLLVLAPPGCDAAELTRRHQIGWTHADHDVEGLASSLRRGLAGELPVPRDLHELTVPHVMARLDGLLRDLLAR